MSNQRVELTKEQWELISLTLDECNQPDLSSDERIQAHIISDIIDLQTGRFGSHCSHRYGRIVSTVCVNRETRMQPAEYESTAECLICGDEVDAQDVETIVK
jgi:hypothetical protein